MRIGPPILFIFSVILLSERTYPEFERPLHSRITSVTVYSDRALVTRLGESHFTPGKYTIKLSGLPATLNDQSVRATGSGTATAKILDVQVETVYLDTKSDQRTKSLQDKLKS